MASSMRRRSGQLNSSEGVSAARRRRLRGRRLEVDLRVLVRRLAEVVLREEVRFRVPAVSAEEEVRRLRRVVELVLRRGAGRRRGSGCMKSGRSICPSCTWIST